MRAAAALFEHQGRIKKKVFRRNFAVGIPRCFFFDLFGRQQKPLLPVAFFFFLIFPWWTRRAAAARI